MNQSNRRSLSKAERTEIYKKTKGRCHICGGPLGNKWTADHVIPHIRGGKHSLDNYLPACPICNRLRWKWGPKKIRKILRLGIYANGEIDRNTTLGKDFEKLYRNRCARNRERRE